MFNKITIMYSINHLLPSTGGEREQRPERAESREQRAEREREKLKQSKIKKQTDIDQFHTQFLVKKTVILYFCKQFGRSKICLIKPEIS